MSNEERFWALVAEQKGLGTNRQAQQCGVPRHRLRLFMKQGLLRRREHGILQVTGAPRTREQDLVLGVLIASNRSGGTEVTSAIAGPTAAHLWGLQEKDEPTIHVVTTRKIGSRAGYRFHWSTRLTDAEVAVIDGIMVTDPIRTFFDLCRMFPYSSTFFLKKGMRKDLFTRADVERRLAEESRQGRGGLSSVRNALVRTDPTADRAKSFKEDHYFDLLVRLGYPPPERNVKVRGTYGHEWEIDLYYPQTRLGFEISPYDTHMEPAVNSRDGRKRLDLRTLGIEILTITDGISDADFERQVRAILGPPEEFPFLEVAR
jgi:hypothetical protein